MTKIRGSSSIQELLMSNTSFLRLSDEKKDLQDWLQVLKDNFEWAIHKYKDTQLGQWTHEQNASPAKD
jgi:ketosteroid isomerase-like protein